MRRPSAHRPCPSDEIAETQGRAHQVPPPPCELPVPLVWINEPGRVFVARRGRSELTTTILTEGQIRDLVEKMLKTTGRRVDVSTPFA
jgi:hypothetical protein